MKQIDRDGKIICIYQAKLFEQSVTKLNMSSAVFVRRFMHSEVVKEFDSLAFLDGTESLNNIFERLDEEYGPSTYGREKYSKDVMYWCGYLYRYFAYTYEISSYDAYKALPFKYVASTYISYHTLSIPNAIERLLEAKGISFSEEAMIKKGMEILRQIHAQERKTK